MKKIFVLDTNVLLHDPRAIFSFEDNDVVVPIVVIEELDKFKKASTRSAGTRARCRGSSMNTGKRASFPKA